MSLTPSSETPDDLGIVAIVETFQLNEQCIAKCILNALAPNLVWWTQATA